MKRKYKYTSCILLATGLVASSAALACGAAGPSTHVGPVLAVEPQAGTFTILDAEKQSPITFNASSAIIVEVKQASGSILVDYETENGALWAKDIRY